MHTLTRKNAARLLLSALLAVLLLCGCRERPLSARKIHRRCASGVALVANKHYFSVRVGAKTVYFNGTDSDGKLLGVTESVDSATKRARTVYGTGFLINGKGDMLTARRVVRPEAGAGAAKADTGAWLAQIRACLEAGAGGSPEDRAKALERLDGMRPGDLIVSCASDVKVAFHDSDTSQSAMQECRVTKVSGINDADLAVIQLKTRKTPRGKYVFHFLSKNRGKRTMFETAVLNLRADDAARRLTAGAPLCMISFGGAPAGGESGGRLAAETVEGGILRVAGDGSISCSFPARAASSGSPVVNMFGDVVCVNVAGAGGEASPGFGVPLGKVKDFLGMD